MANCGNLHLMFSLYISVNHLINEGFTSDRHIKSQLLISLKQACITSWGLLYLGHATVLQALCQSIHGLRFQNIKKKKKNPRIPRNTRQVDNNNFGILQCKYDTVSNLSFQSWCSYQQWLSNFAFDMSICWIS